MVPTVVGLCGTKLCSAGAVAVAWHPVFAQAVAMHPQRRLVEPQVEEEEEEEELVSNCQPIGLHSSAVCGGESE